MRIDKIIKHYGKNNQIDKAIEELKELSDELKKYKKAKSIEKELDIKENILQESADVMLMLTQLCRIFNFTQKDLFTMCEFKIDRTLKRIEKEKEGLK